MYLTHFGLNQSPFGITPNPLFFYSGNKRGAILEALIYAVTHGEGIVKVTGEVGSGKTMLCRMLESLLPPNIEVIYLVNPTLGRDEVVYAIAGELGLATGGRRADEVIRMLQNDLIVKHAAGKQVLLLVEEAQAMPLDTLEEIRLFSNLETAHHKLLQIVLFGQPELDESLNLPRMRQLKERITHSFKVPPLEPTLLPEFLMFRMRAAGYHGPDIFTRGAVKLLAQVSEGIIRRVSILADKSLLAAFADNTHSISVKHIRAAIEDSEFSSPRRGVPRWWLGAAFVVALATAAATWLWINPDKSRTTPVAQNVTRAPVESVTPAAVVPAIVPAAALPAALPAVAMVNADTPVATVTAAASALVVPPPRSPQQQLQESKAWLAALPAERLSVQVALMEVDSGPIERFLAKLGDEVGMENVHVYPTRIGTALRYGVLVSAFELRADALAMKTRIANEWGYAPQLRTVAGIRAEIERTKSGEMWPK